MPDQDQPKRFQSFEASSSSLIPELPSSSASNESGGDDAEDGPAKGPAETLGEAPRETPEEAPEELIELGLEHEVTPTQASRPAPAARAWAPYRTLGLALAAAGVGLAAAPFFSWQAAQFMEPLGNPLVPGATLFLAGLVLFGVGVLRRALTSIQGEVAHIVSETTKLDQIADQARNLQHEFRDVETTLGASRADVQTLHDLVEQLMQLATNPEFEVSLFRMAASLDQLGARLDVSMKEHFTTVTERFEGLREDSARTAEGLTSEVQDLVKQLGELSSEQREGERETRAQFEASASDLQERLARGHEAIERTCERTGEQLVHLEESFSQDLRQRIDSLHEQFGRDLQATADRTGERVQELSGLLDGLGGELGQLEGTLGQAAEQRSRGLLEQLQSDAHAAAEQSGERLDAGLLAMTGLGEDLGRVQSSLDAGFAELSGLSGLSGEAERAAENVTARLADLQRELHQVVAGLGTQLSERADRQATELLDQEAQEEARAQRLWADLQRSLERNQAQVEQTIVQRCDALEGDLTALAELLAEAQASAPEPAPEPVPECVEQTATDVVFEVAEQVVEDTPPEPRHQAAPAPRSALPASALPFGHDVPASNESSVRPEGELGLDGPLPARDEAAHGPHELEPRTPDYPVERLGTEFDDGWIDG